MNARQRPTAAPLAVAVMLSTLAFALAPPEARPAPASPAGGRDEVSLTLREKVIKDLSSSGLVLAFHVLVANPAEAPRELVRYRYRVRIDQKEYINTEIALDAPLAVPAGGRTLIALPVKITYELLFKVTGPIEGQALCDIVGDMYFRNERLKEQRASFAYSGEFPIFKDPEVDLLPLDVLDLTVGGADVVFHPRFKNLNRYDLIVETIDYELFFSGRPVQAGSIPGDKSLPGTGEKSFALPFLLDFFEAGDDVRAGFAQDEFPCRFAGRVVIASVWGRLAIRFDRTQPLRLNKKV
ncbi:MAG: LEA type 2 family protein [Acidobacteriota bacterium]